MTNRYFLYFAYDGTNYHGWQLQPNGNSVQEELQRALSVLLRQPVNIVGAGRTDAGVHARKMAAHFDIEQDAPMDCTRLTYKLNRMLPPDISVFDVQQVPGDLHARFSAKWRTYHYYLHFGGDPFVRHYSYACHFALDFEAMNQAAAHLLTVNDFGAFCKAHTDVKTTLCQVTQAQWVQDDDTHWHFVITANRFLRNMVRAVVGTLVDVGRHRISIADFDRIVAGGQRSAAGESMPAHALFLENIIY